MVSAFPLIELAGPAEQRGLAYGRAAKARIDAGIAHYGAQLRAAGLEGGRIADLVRGFLPTIKAFDESMIAEMRGIARGAEASFEDIVLLNARTEILQLARRRALAAETQETDGGAEEGCTAVLAMPEVTTEGLLQAQNWDWKAACAETAVVLHIRRDDGPDILTFTEAGGLARSGLNAAGIGLTANYLQCDRDYRELGVPLALIRRKVLAQQHLALAWRVVQSTKKSAANNMCVSHAKGLAINFECAPDEAFVLEAEEGLLVHSNHFLSPVALSKLRDTGIESTPCTLYRHTRVREALAPLRGKIDRTAIKNALFDDFGSPWSVCRPPRMSVAEGGAAPVETATVAMIVMRPGEGAMDIAPLPALSRRFTTYRLTPDRTATRSAA
jgi:isopenicillin-N N-acyltransferase like protein